MAGGIINHVVNLLYYGMHFAGLSMVIATPGRSGVSRRWRLVVEELKKVGGIACPMVAVILMQYFLQIVSVIAVGHTGSQLFLSAATIAFSMTNISGLCIHLGMSGGLETLGGQAYGAQQHQKLGTLTYTAMFSQTLVSFPLALIWLFMDKALLLLRQDRHIAREAGKFARRLIPSLFAHALFQPLVRYFQMQCLIWPLLLGVSAAFLVHTPLCWLLVYHTRLAANGAAVAFDVSSWLFAAFLGSFMAFSPKCAKTRAPISVKTIGVMSSEVGTFLWFAMLSALMVCLEYWAFEIIVLLAGLFQNPELETSVLALCVSTLTAVYTIPYGIGCGACTRVSNELGSGNAERVNVAIFTVILLAAINAITVSSTLFATRHICGYVFSNDDQVVEYFATIVPLVCCSVIVDSFLCVLTGVSRGCGLQKFVTVINVVAYYVCGIPTSALLGFKLKLKGKGLWGGVLVGESVQLVSLFVVICCTNWNKQAIRAQNRAGGGRSLTESTRDEMQTNDES